MLLVFDLDGTLIDSRRDLADAGNALLRSYGARPLDEPGIVRMVGEGAAVLVERLLSARDVGADRAEALQRFLALYDERLVDHTRPYEGVTEALTALQSWSVLAVLTNKPTRATRRILEALALAPFFAAVIGGDGPHGRKPSPAALHALMREAGVEPGATVVVGDSWVDLETARNAGTRVCLARYGFGFEHLPAGALRGDELMVAHPADIPTAILGTRSAEGGAG
jgi:phosphoglycolate phosphatase